MPSVWIVPTRLGLHFKSNYNPPYIKDIKRLLDTGQVIIISVTYHI